MEGGLITPPALIGTGPLMGVTSAPLDRRPQGAGEAMATESDQPGCKARPALILHG
jgi:hypothetical protein